jgi:DNA-directed RNA polymerase specialized sigma24 family protein
MARPNKDHILNSVGFHRFLSWLDDGADSSGESYLEMHRRLARYFDRRNCPQADELADETLSRVARKLEEKGEILDVSPAHYCYITAKFVFLESLRRNEQHQVSLQEVQGAGQGKADLAVSAQADSETLAKEKRYECLDNCLGKLQASDRELILDYYGGKGREKIERRLALAERLGLTMNALSIRACRIRSKLEACVRACTRET